MSRVTLKLPAWWIHQCRGWADEQSSSKRELAAALGRAIHRRPFNHAFVIKYLQGQSASLDLTRAFALLRGVAPPVLIASSQDEADLAHAAVRVARKRPASAQALRRLFDDLEDS